MPRNKWFFQSGTVGEFTSAGLPNITGMLTDVSARREGTITGSGAFTASKIGTWKKGGTDSAVNYSTINFNASQSNPIYNSSVTVQPKSISCYLMMYVN